MLIVNTALLAVKALPRMGSSGGAAINEQMQLAGTTPGGSFSLNGKSFRFGVLIPPSEIKICLSEWSGD